MSLILTKIICQLIGAALPTNGSPEVNHQEQAESILANYPIFAPVNVVSNLTDYLNPILVPLDGYSYTFQMEQIVPIQQPEQRIEFRFKCIKIEKHVTSSDIIFEASQP